MGGGDAVDGTALGCEREDGEAAGGVDLTAVAFAARASSIAVSTACVAVNTTVVAAASPPTGATADWCPSCAVPLLFFADGGTANELFGRAAGNVSTRCHRDG